MTTPTDDVRALHRARDLARQYAAATAAMSEYLDRASAVIDPAEIAEFGALLAREQATRAERDDVLRELGLDLPSIEDDEG